MYGNLNKSTYPPILKITLIINKNVSLVFGIHIDYSARSSLKGKRGSEFLVQISFGAQATYPHFSHPEISSDLYRSQRVPERELGGGQDAPFAPVATPII